MASDLFVGSFIASSAPGASLSEEQPRVVSSPRCTSCVSLCLFLSALALARAVYFGACGELWRGRNCKVRKCVAYFSYGRQCGMKSMGIACEGHHVNRRVLRFKMSIMTPHLRRLHSHHQNT